MDGSSGLDSCARAKQSPFAWPAFSTDMVQELKNAIKDKQEYYCENGSWRVSSQGRQNFVVIAKKDEEPTN